MPGGRISEQRFEEFLVAAGLEFERIPESNVKTPDYWLHLVNGDVIAEVKELDELEIDRQVLEKGRRTGRVAYWGTGIARLRNHIHKANKQLKSLNNGAMPTLLIVNSNSRTGDFDGEDLRAAMFGDETVTFWYDMEDSTAEPVASEVGLNSNGQLRPDRNTSTSAVCELWHAQGKHSLGVFHNPHAAIPLDPSWLRVDGVRHFSLKTGQENLLPTWHEV